jgi:hypothetical protein
MKQKMFLITLLLFLAISTHTIEEIRVPLQQSQIQKSRVQLVQRLHELRDILNKQAHRLEDPAVLTNIVNLIKILLPLAAFTVVGYKAYRQTFGDQPPKEQLIVTAPMKMPEPSVPSLVYQIPPSENVKKFFSAIENLTPNQIIYLDALIPQLEERYGLDAIKVQQHGYSLLSAAVVGSNLDAFNKAQLIRWLREYGIKPTELDRKRAHSLGDSSVIDALK